jgi:hypothetical protein
LDVLWFVALNGAVGWAGYLGAARFIPGAFPLSRWIAAATLSWTWVTLGMQVLGAAGQMARLPLLGWAVTGLALAGLLNAIVPEPSSESGPATKPERGQVPGSFGIETVVVSALLLWLGLTLASRSLTGPVKVVSDGPIYHLYFAIRWWQEGRISWIASPFGESAATYFPANGELWFSWLVTAWGGDRFARIGQAPFLILAGGALYGIMRGVGISSVSGLLAVAWATTLIPLVLFTFEPNVDTIFIAGYLVSVHFLARYAWGELGTRAMILAGLAAGLALGTKPTGIVFIPPWLLIASVLIVRRPASRSARFWGVAALWISSLLPSVFWMIRNAAATGNPWYPLQLEVLGRVLLSGWYPRQAMQESPFYIAVGNWRAFVDILVIVWDPRLVPIWLLAMACLWRIGKASRAPIRDGWVTGLCLLGLLNVALYWFGIPYRTQQRFMLHGLALLAVPLAGLFDRWVWVRRLAVGLLAIHLLTPFNWPFAPAAEQPPWSLEKTIPPLSDAVIRIPWSLQEWRALGATKLDPQEAFLQSVYQARLAMGVLSLALAAVWVWLPQSARTRTLTVVLSSLLALAGAAWWMGYRVGTLAYSYPGFEYYPAWTFLEGISPRNGGLRVAYAGTNLPYYLLGKDARNSAAYVNVDGHPLWQMHDYQRAAVAQGDPPLWDTPRPGWDRIRPDYSAWVENLKRQRIDVLFVAQANPPDGLFNCADAENFPIERVWADQHPERFSLIYGGNLPDSRTGGRPDHRVRIYRVLP